MNISFARLCWLYFGSSGAGCFLFALVLIGAVALFIGIGLFVQESHYREYGRTAPATVLQKGQAQQMEHGAKGVMRPVTVYWVRYEYADESGNRHHGQANLAQEVWNSVKEGSELTIQYAADQPGQSRPAAEASSANWVGAWICTGLGVLFFGGGCVLTVVGVVSAIRAACLVRDGVPTLGRVTDVKTAQTVVKDKVRLSYDLTYGYLDASGATHSGRLQNQNDLRWQVGELLLVLYDPNRPGHHEADVHGARNAELVRLEAQES